MAMEVITTTDKAARDRMFREFRNSDDLMERQVVKFSSARPVISDSGEPQTYYVGYTATGKGGKLNFGKPQVRPVYETTYSVAYPVASPERVPPNHGSTRNPRKFPGRKVQS